MNYLISVVNPGAMDRVCEIAAALDLPQTSPCWGTAPPYKACWIFSASSPPKSVPS